MTVPDAYGDRQPDDHGHQPDDHGHAGVHIRGHGGGRAEPEQRPEQPERTERPERPEQPERTERSERPERTGRRGARRPGRRSAAPEPPGSGAAAVDAEPDPESVARAIALRLLTGAPRSRAQLAEAMARKDVPEPVAQQVLDRFTEVGLVDDAEYARILVRSRQADRGLARRALSMELRRKGIDDELAAEALSTVDADLEERTARDLARRRLAATAGLAREVRVRRVTAMLGRKGYPGGLAHRVVREALAEEGADAGDGTGAVDASWDVDAMDADPSVFAEDD
jgi:regulatory protein